MAPMDTQPDYDRVSSEELFQQLLDEGVLSAFYFAVQEGCSTEYVGRHRRYDHPKLNYRAKGNDRWNSVDQAFMHTAEKVGFEVLWVPVGKGKHPEMMFLRRENLLISVHQTRSPNLAPPYAKHRAERMAGYHQPPLYDNLEELMKAAAGPIEPVEYVYYMLSYEQTKKEFPGWVTFGKPALGQKDFVYSRDLAIALGIVLEHEKFEIDLNPSSETPAPRISRPADKKKEGEGDE
jgi:hypothetical protein